MEADQHGSARRGIKREAEGSDVWSQRTRVARNGPSEHGEGEAPSEPKLALRKSTTTGDGEVPVGVVHPSQKAAKELQQSQSLRRGLDGATRTMTLDHQSYSMIEHAFLCRICDDLFQF